MYSYRNGYGEECVFKCNLEDKVIVEIGNGSTIRIGKVVALDDDGYVTIETPNEEIRVYNTDIVCIANEYPEYDKVLGRCWLYEVNFKPNTNWMNDNLYHNEGQDDWLVGEFTEGELWMNNNIGYVVLVQPCGICLFDYI